MTADELRAAAERLRRAEAVDSLAAVYGPMADKDNAGAYLRDRNALLAAWFREHPADDELPVTEEWLREVGFGDNGYNYAGSMLRLGGFEYRTGPSADGWSRWYYCGVLITDENLGTRGHVRRLLAALGIPLAPKG